MSETVKVGRNRPPQNGWASKEEVAELRAEVAELRETNQKMLEEIKGLRAELGGAKRRHFLGAVATSAAAFFGKFFHRGEDLGDIPEKKLGKRENKRGAHAKEKEKSDTPIASARKDEKSKNNSREKEEKEDKQNKDKHPLAKKVAAFALAALMVGGSIAGISQCSSHDINGSDAPITEEMDNKDLENHAFGSTQASAEENDAAKAEAAHQQQLAETMGMSVEDMHAVADRHGVNYNDIGTVNAHDQMRDNLESDYNLSESFNLKDKSEAEQIEWGHKEVVFANMNNMYFTAEMMAARKQNMQAGTGDSFDVQVARELFAEYQRNPEAWKRDALDNNSVLKNSKTSIRQATSEQTFSVMTEGKYDGNMKDCKTSENSGGESEHIVQEKLSEPDGESTVVDIKSGCGQMTWKVILRSQQPQVEERVVQQQGGKRRIYKEEQGEWHNKEQEHEEGERRTPPSDAKDEHADDPSERAQDDNQETPRSKVGSEMTHDKQQHNKDGSPTVDNNGNMNDTQGDDDSDRPGEVNQDQGSGGSGSGEHVAGGGATDTSSGNQGGSGEGSTGSNKTDSGGSSGEASQNHQGSSSSWTRDRGSEESGSWRKDSNGNEERESSKSSYDTGRVEKNGDSNDAAGGNVELQSLSSVPISQED